MTPRQIVEVLGRRATSLEILRYGFGCLVDDDGTRSAVVLTGTASGCRVLYYEDYLAYRSGVAWPDRDYADPAFFEQVEADLLEACDRRDDNSPRNAEAFDAETDVYAMPNR